MPPLRPRHPTLARIAVGIVAPLSRPIAVSTHPLTRSTLPKARFTSTATDALAVKVNEAEYIPSGTDHVLKLTATVVLFTRSSAQR